jgi:hypothetical protein
MASPDLALPATAARRVAVANMGPRRCLQLALAAIWLLDAILQLQPFMFTKRFGQLLAASAAGNPAVIADPIRWSARLIEGHPTWTNAAFASVQLFLALGIAWRPTVKAALAASVVWSLGVWWIGEGLGSVLTGSASPVSGAPGAVLIYALLAVLLWPAEPQRAFVAAGSIGARSARLAWLVVWGSLACFAIQAANVTAQGLHDMLSGMTAGEPGWLAALDRTAASLLASQGALTSAALAMVLGVIAVGIFGPEAAVRAVVLLASVVALVIWIVGENFGGILTGSGTDPSSGLLLMLLAAAYWPAGRRSGARGRLRRLVGIHRNVGDLHVLGDGVDGIASARAQAAAGDIHGTGGDPMPECIDQRTVR